MAGNLITVTDAGRAALVAPGNAGTTAHRIVEIGLATAAFAPDSGMKAVPNERKRITTFAGENVAADTIHVTLKDDTADQFSLYGFGLYLENGVLAAVYGQATPIMEKSPSAMLLLSADLQFTTIDAAQLVFGDATFTNPPATTERQGVVELATSVETIAGTDTQRAVTPAGMAAAIIPAIAGKSDKGHRHAVADVDGLQGVLDAKAPAAHRHAIADVTGLQDALDTRLGVNGGNVAGDIDLNFVAGNPRGIHWKTAAGYRWYAFANGATETGGNAGSDLSIARFDDRGAYLDTALTIARATGVANFLQRPTWANVTPWDSGNLKPYTRAGGELDGNAPVQTRTAYGKTAYQVLAPDGTGIGGTLASWKDDRAPAMQIDTPSSTAAYMAVRWTRPGGRNLAAIDAWEGGSATSAPRIDFHLDGQASAWQFGRTDITRGAGGTVYGTWNFDPATKVSISGATMTGRLQLAPENAYGEIGFRSTDRTWQYLRGRNAGGGMEWVNNAYNSVVATMDDAGSFWGQNLWARGQIQAAGRVIAANGGGQLCEDGNIYGGVWGGYLSNWMNNKANAGSVCQWVSGPNWEYLFDEFNRDNHDAPAPKVVVGFRGNGANNTFYFRAVELRNQ